MPGPDLSETVLKTFHNDMRIKTYTKQGIVIGACLLVTISGCSPQRPQKQDAVFQASVMTALSAGVFDGSLTCAGLLDHGNFGLGTFNDLDGEMILLGGQLYQVKVDGSLIKPQKDLKIPFATVTFFHPDSTVAFERSDYAQIRSYLDKMLVHANIIYAIRIDGTFSSVTVRSVPPQSQPYPDLATAISQQQIFKFSNVTGTMLGFWFPDYAKNFNAAGYHFHFIDKEHRIGGHLLDAQLLRGTVSIDRNTELVVSLPQTANFNNADLRQGPQRHDIAEK